VRPNYIRLHLQNSGRIAVGVEGSLGSRPLGELTEVQVRTRLALSGANPESIEGALTDLRLGLTCRLRFDIPLTEDEFYSLWLSGRRT